MFEEEGEGEENAEEVPKLVQVNAKVKAQKAQNDKEDAEKEAAMIKEVRGKYILFNH